MILSLQRGALACMLALVSASAAAQGVIYKCTPPGGSVEYTDIKRGNYCTAMDLPGTVIAAPPRRAAPARSPTQAGQPAAVPVPAAFPRVDNAEQRARDADRRAILEDELKSEQQKLAELRFEYNNGAPERRGDERNYAKYQERTATLRDSVGRAEKNVEALKREIANIR
ncbi:UNVERIFIED_ORG: uncharacterized protein DUF4124 [Zoogloea ramigera]|uniref:DUF4124 domain-containing protein n=1 Tax=Duganella zoogloeoides TaxID=75659 RepID=A0ABZ0XWM1_9BURK|nr:DUF4124 domain-containing protein [Duganella zoogloeoides]WQH03515.1 DUF4124 domain-containing protein [Duganella zoogloeoides]